MDDNYVYHHVNVMASRIYIEISWSLITKRTKYAINMLGNTIEALVLPWRKRNIESYLYIHQLFDSTNVCIVAYRISTVTIWWDIQFDVHTLHAFFSVVSFFRHCKCNKRPNVHGYMQSNYVTNVVGFLYYHVSQGNVHEIRFRNSILNRPGTEMRVSIKHYLTPI